MPVALYIRARYCLGMTKNCATQQKRGYKYMKNIGFMKNAVATTMIVASLSAFADGQDNLPNLLSPGTISQDNYLPDFSFAGYRNGGAELPEACLLYTSPSPRDA